MNTDQAGWYYLHTSGDLVWKGAVYTEERDLEQSPFVVSYWPFRPADRETAWTTLVEALAAGAHDYRVAALAAQWGCDDADGYEYAKRINVTLFREGLAFAAIPPTGGASRGVGQTVLAALALLARTTGWKPQKTGGTFPAHLHRDVAAGRASYAHDVGA